MDPQRVLLSRLQKELEDFSTSPPPFISCWPRNDDVTDLEAVIEGADGTPYAKGRFKLEISIPPRYPFEPPKVRFITKIYHPNIDEGGRICLDILKPKPKGNWVPVMNIRSALLSIQSLMADPNPDDPLVQYISEQFIRDRQGYFREAQEWTRRFALPESEQATSTTLNDSATIRQEEKTPASPSPSPPDNASHKKLITLTKKPLKLCRSKDSPTDNSSSEPGAEQILEAPPEPSNTKKRKRDDELNVQEDTQDSSLRPPDPKQSKVMPTSTPSPSQPSSGKKKISLSLLSRGK